ncbi:hypothetical protein [uncultured Phycicoccus sp.]|uniref:hypothetical protein n=1 Tax=uncultured Phycicoccus sp. TaxID=661422 RepID=UPI002612D270|nr:hypothetical protein [uncultured Phycicoccus sp.]
MGRAELLRRWVLANTVGETLGLGATGLLAWLVVGRSAEPSAVGAVLAGFAIVVLSGAVEATVVGLLQHRAVHPWLPGLTRRAWWWATLWGALTAYVLGYLPSTVVSLLSVDGDAAPVPEPPQGVVVLAAAGLGLVAGAVLAWAQTLVLRHHVARAWRWVPANMLAWAVGMPMIFVGMDLAFRDGGVVRTAAVVVATLASAGAVVGVINGSFLTRMVLPTLEA